MEREASRTFPLRQTLKSAQAITLTDSSAAGHTGAPTHAAPGWVMAMGTPDMSETKWCLRIFQMLNKQKCHLTKTGDISVCPIGQVHAVH